MAQDREPPTFEAFDDRLRRLEASREQPPALGRGAVAGPRTRMGAGAQVGIELAAGVLGGALLGWALDTWLGTRPVLLLVLLVLGAAGGMLNAYRALMRAGRQRPEDGGTGR